MRLVCFPHAGGSASYFFPYARVFGPDVDVLPVQYPGRQDRRREGFIDNIAELADRVSVAVLSDVPAPFAFFGHSMGAVLAFEVARRLRDKSAVEPVALFLSGRRAPDQRRTNDDVHRRPDEGVLAELRRVAGTDPRVLADPEMRAALLPVTRNDYRAIEMYRCEPGVPLDVPITVLVGDADPTTTVGEAAGWRAYTTAAFDLRVFPGGHFYLDSARSAVAGTITESLRTGPVTSSKWGKQ
jgi:surfactin synthase thioesterase subunit